VEAGHRVYREAGGSDPNAIADAGVTLVDAVVWELITGDKLAAWAPIALVEDEMALVEHKSGVWALLVSYKQSKEGSKS
jgi:hypothetical protein